ncbi:helix-turn-helix domain-containing protein [Sphingobium psychrophilum]|uniref:helix-turn-helix domain-containing protein n=1 Tax=Sphingobium psychrophilum TaxID=2728834 RepID=UPI0038B4498F
MTESEAADRLSLCTRTLRKERQAGRLRYVLIGRAVRYSVADLESYVEQLRQVQPACPPADPTRRTSVQRPAGGGVVVPFTERNARR